jgi:hypothetical protein
MNFNKGSSVLCNTVLLRSALELQEYADAQNIGMPDFYFLPFWIRLGLQLKT